MPLTSKQHGVDLHLRLAPELVVQRLTHTKYSLLTFVNQLDLRRRTTHHGRGRPRDRVARRRHRRRPARRRESRFRGVELSVDVVTACKTHAKAIVPDPRTARSSHYDACAEWMAAIFELDPAAYEQIRAAWSVTHKARRNLWRALAAKRLPVS